jgi:hypothetical protein
MPYPPSSLPFREALLLRHSVRSDILMSSADGISHVGVLAPCIGVQLVFDAIKYLIHRPVIPGLAGEIGIGSPAATTSESGRALPSTHK